MSAEKKGREAEGDSGGKKSDETPPPAPVGQEIRIGQPRFELSGGFVYSPLPRRTYQVVKGFERDAQGKPTGDGKSTIVDYEENSERRLMPMAMLNTRLAGSERASLFLSLGITAKRDKDVDVEYLIGPTVGVLNDRLMFTVGAYGGKVQRLLPDIVLGSKLPDDAGKEMLFRKGYGWKPGFALTYGFPTTKKKTENDAAGGSNAGADAVKAVIHIGGVPFSLSAGLAYTSLGDRSYGPVIGYVKDRQGNVTDRQSLVRIVGRTSSSTYRLVPLALLHSRVEKLSYRWLNFYLTTGITGKNENGVKLEYLLGGSVNLFHPKIYLTFGTFAGKQEFLGGDLYEGFKLDGQSVATQSRYVWKPAVSISYDITKVTKP